MYDNNNTVVGLGLGFVGDRISWYNAPPTIWFIWPLWEKKLFKWKGLDQTLFSLTQSANATA